jgi:hypothetical protein
MKKALPTSPWLHLFFVTILASHFYVFMEWLFFITKPSALASLPLLEAIQVHFSTTGLLLIVLLPSLTIFMLASRLGASRLFIGLGTLLPATLLDISGLLLLDNFTYTLFTFGIVSVKGIWRIGYGLLLFIGIFYIWRSIRQNNMRWNKRPAAANAFLGLFPLLILFSSAFGQLHKTDDPLAEAIQVPPTRRPNILILGSDGLNSAHLSAYGYQRETTPFLESILPEFLIAENAFTNASSTTASTTAVLTSKEPIETDVMRYPDILEGEDQYQHLPGILQKFGYTAVQLGVPYWVDANALNLQDGFDSINNALLEAPILRKLRDLLGESHTPYFAYTLSQRASERVLHALLIAEMQNPIAAVNNPKERMTDQQRTERIINLLEENKSTPLFIFAHFMDTHGAVFSPREQVYSDGNPAQFEWHTDFYDDAILGFDHYLEQIYESLKEKNLLENTIIVIYTDHGLRYVTNTRLPLVMRFPDGTHAGTVRANAQNIDIAPTILDYMEIPPPDWMQGTSLLERPPRTREIFTIIGGSPKKVTAPFYQIKTVQLIVCHRWYQLNVQSNSWTSGTIKGHSAPCRPQDTPDDQVAHEKIIAYLQEYGFDVSSLH